ALSLSGRAALVQMQSLDWPNRVVRFIVPFAAGGPTDIVARVVTEQLSKIWGQQAVIENRGGAGTNIGNEMAARSDPDGYTVLFATAPRSQPQSLPLAQLRSDCGFYGSLPRFQVFIVHVCAELVTDQIGHGVRGLCKGASGQAHTGIPRHRQHAAFGRRAAQANGRDRDDACALSWRVARPQRPHPRPRGLLFRQRRAARKHAVRPAAWTCGYRRQKRSGGAGIAHNGRGRRSGLRGVVVARLVRAGEDAV